MTFDTKVFDTGTNYSTSTGEFVAPITGYYFFTSTVSVTQATGYVYTIYLYHNGSSAAQGTQITTANTNSGGYTVSALLSLAANDYVQVYPYTSNSGGQGVNVGVTTAFFTGFLVSNA